MALIEERYRTDLAFKSDYLSSANGGLQKISGEGNAQQALLHRLLTEPGTLVHRPDYGVGIKRFLNAVNNIDNRNALANRIKEQYELDDRVDEVVSVSIDFSPDDPELVLVRVRANLIGIGEVSLQFQPFTQRVD